MARKSRKTQRRRQQKGGRFRSSERSKQNGGGWGFDGPAFAPAGGMAPESARALTDDCAVLDRPAPAVVPTGAWVQTGGACGSCAIMAPQVGGNFIENLFGGKPEEKEKGTGASDVAEPVIETPVSSEVNTNTLPSATPALAGGARRKSRKARRSRRQRGGGGGGGGYGFQLNNDLGKVYANLPVGPCPSAPQRGGGVTSLGDAALVSYPAGYGYGPASAMEVNNGTAHFLAQIPYGKQCMGGGARKATGGKGGARRHRKSHKKSRKGRKSRRHH